ncbi:uncharacterized protein LOC131678312 [Topomyia yanbarensis]|uniref:uncharacterized protein LOC131678312 n=1 Tax=Topomyia yanbarensis TaxID=2498891 RepID=UPI00273B315B|nr:uncharacterized protein LOC131678312 [Topomyia yanbarensis]
MSYTTQRDFFNVTFRNEDPKPPERKRSDGALMTYEFCTDGRAWALDKEKRSKYILDVVHKARFKKAVLHPDGQFELSKNYLLNMEVDDLANYIVSLQAEVKRKNETVQQLEETRRVLGEQLDSAQQQSQDRILIQQQSAILQQERNEFEQQIDDLEEAIICLKDRADRYDLLAKENELLRCQLQKHRAEVANKMQLAHAEAEANFNRMRANDCEKLEAELIIFKAEYEELRKQKRELKEQLQKSSICKVRLSELKRQLATEQAEREKVEERMEHLLAIYDKQYQELQRKSDYIVESNQRMERIHYDQRWEQDHGVPVIEEPLTAKSSHQTLFKPSASAELLVESCANCQRMEAEIARLKNLQDDVSKRDELRNWQEQVRQLEDALTRCKAQQGTTETQTLELQKQLQEAREELSQKDVELDSYSGLMERMSSYQSRIEDLEEEQQFKANQLAASMTELQQTKEQLNQLLSAPKDVSEKIELNAVKQLNNDLQKKIEQLESELAAAKAYSKELIENSADKEELLKTIAALKSEIQAVQGIVKAQEEEIIRLEGEYGIPGLVQQFSDHRFSPDVRIKSSALGDRPMSAEALERGARPRSAGATGITGIDTTVALNREARLISASAVGAAGTPGTIVAPLGARAKSSGAIEDTHSFAREARLQSDGSIHGEDYARATSLPPEALPKSAEAIDRAQWDEAKAVSPEAKLTFTGAHHEIDSARVISRSPGARSKSARTIGENDAEEGTTHSPEAQSKLTSPNGKDGSARITAGRISAAAFGEAGTVGARARTKSAGSISETGSARERDRIKSTGPVVEVGSTQPGAEASSAGTVARRKPAGAIGKVGATKVGTGLRTKSAGAVDEEVTSPDDQLESDMEGNTAISPETQLKFSDELDRSVNFQDNVKELGANKTEIEGRPMDSSKVKKSSITAEEVISQLNENFITIGETVATGSSDPSRTKIIALKIVQHGISILILPELDHLHREIYRATLDRYLTLGKTVQFLDNAFCDNCNILNTMQTMGNNEMRAMISSSTQVPIANPLLLDDQIPTRLPPEHSHRPQVDGTAPKPKQRAKTANFADTKDSNETQQVFALFTKGSSLHPNKKTNNRLLIDKCRTRPWRSPKTPPK